MAESENGSLKLVTETQTYRDGIMKRNSEAVDGKTYGFERLSEALYASHLDAIGG